MDKHKHETLHCPCILKNEIYYRAVGEKENITAELFLVRSERERKNNEITNSCGENDGTRSGEGRWLRGANGEGEI